MEEELINFGDEIECTSGGKPSVAMNNNGVVVEVDQFKSSIYCCVGIRKLGKSNNIEWGGSHKFDSGIKPHVAINNYGCVVVVHQSPYHPTLWYHVGKINVENKSIDWGSSNKYDDGITPAIDINDNGKVVEVHETDNQFSNSLFYRVGDINEGTKKIKFNKSREYTTGKYPSVALNKAEQVIEVHVSQGMSDALWYKVGTISGDQIGFSGSIHYDDGACPSIALNDEEHVIEAHKSENNDTLFFHQGTLAGSTLYIGRSRYYGHGKNPSVAAAFNGSTLYAEVHERSNKIYCHSVQLSSRSEHDDDDAQLPGMMKYLHLISWKEDQHVHKFELVNRVSAKWREFGIQLGLQTNTLDGYSKETLKVTECWEKVMQNWLDGQGAENYPVKWEGLYRLLEDVGVPQVAIDFEKAVEKARKQDSNMP